MAHLLAFLALALAVCLPLACHCAPLMGMYVSTGDNDWVWESPPVSSAQTIAETFDAAQRIYGVDRIYWRGIQSELVCRHFVIRPEELVVAGFWDWEDYLLGEGQQTRLAVEAARERGMEFWGMTGFFEHGAHAEIDAAKGSGPSVIEDRLRVEHPQWAPVDRRGIRRQAGPVELAYPEARSAQVARYVDLLTRAGYDGLMFYTYVEHFAIRFEDEFGFNEPIVEEYKRRYGVDIRTEDFDHHAWYRLRGEYVTEFVRELSKGLHAAGKKLGIAIDPQKSHFPGPWLCSRETLNVGHIHMDWERWVREGLLDELMVYLNNDKEAAINNAMAVCAGTDCKVSVMQGWSFAPKHKHFLDAGVRCIGVGDGTILETGYNEPQPLSALDGDDFVAKLSLIHGRIEGGGKLTVEQLIRLAGDGSILVRRQALEALGESEDPSAVAAIEAGLADEDQSVRCMAVAALLKNRGEGSVARILETLEHRGTFQISQAALSTLANLPRELTSEVLKGAHSPSAEVRRVVAASLSRGAYRPETVPDLVKLARDEHPQVRFEAAGGLARYLGNAEGLEALLALLQDAHPTVRSKAAVALQNCAGSASRWLSAPQLRVLEALRRAFARCGEGGDPADVEWGWRAIGNSLMQMGPRGEEVLRGWLAQREDLTLADRAWKVLYVPQTGHAYIRTTEQQAVADYALHPSGGKQVPVPAPIVEPARMPYIAQNFDALATYATGEVGDMRSEGGLMRGLGATPPAPVIQDTIKHGETGNALRLMRAVAPPQHEFYVLRADYRLVERQPASVTFRLYREPGAAAAMYWKDSGLNVYGSGLFVTTDGRIGLATGAGDWVYTDATMADSVWQRFRIETNPVAGTYRVFTGETLETPVGEVMPLKESESYNQFILSPQGHPGTSVYLDDVLVEVPNPAFPGEGG